MPRSAAEYVSGRMTGPDLKAPTSLVDWFRADRRPLPWRTRTGTRRDPWATLVSETMSQQTRLEVVVPRFAEWMTRWPTVESFARESEEVVLAAWAGLGYYSRARNLLRAAQTVALSGWPATANALGAIPGVGPYTAAAVASLAFGQQVPMIDGNVLRVLSRVRTLDGDLRVGRGARRLAEVATEWISAGDAGEINEATMELGALLCLPRNPRCSACPVSADCRALELGITADFPVARPRRTTIDIEGDIGIAVSEERVLLRRAGAEELLAGHWTLPELGMLPHTWRRSAVSTGSVKHAITHHKIVWRVHRCDLSGASEPPAGMSWIPMVDLPLRLVSSLPRKALAAAGIARFEGI
jgi:A/G-specific adenine glycosylase